ncbi:MAG: hypothetical protein KDC66_02335 [Phaeodactylibacter sp.]|nr:hypothetical protein [Phaeodactylibacter sp.]MCB9272633.1 hypothetical protein [Lewinellaceae bacterium]
MKFAFAVSAENTFENQHFGDADKFLLFEWADGAFTLLGEEPNPFKGQHGHHGGQVHHHPNGQHGHGHGQHKKAALVTAFFQERGVQALVSRQFGHNIREVCRSFVPILVSESAVDAVCQRLEEHIEGIAAEAGRDTEKHLVLRALEGELIRIAVKD